MFNKNKETVIGWILIVVLMLAFVFYQQKKMVADQKLKVEEKKTEQIQNAQLKEIVLRLQIR